ncbi:MAG: MFS transporter [Bacteroidaceae bacterium]|nr:MFS transporter [Bacteroidaceae bacterium]
MKLQSRLTLMSFLEFAVWGAYLTSMGSYLMKAGLATNIGYFYAVQGFVSLFMPALMGIVADRWIPAQKVLSFCHFMAAFFKLSLFYYGTTTETVSFPILFTLYACSVAFFMPTLALSNSVAYSALERAGFDTIKSFPPIRVFGTIGFIVSMIAVDLVQLQSTPGQFAVSGGLGIILAFYALTLPSCPTSKSKKGKGFVEALGLRAFTLFKQRKMAIFFLFSMLLGSALQITNGYANPFISSFAAYPEYADTFGVQHANILISLSQISEALCFLLIPFFLKRYGIKVVMLIAMFAWVLRFGFFGLGNPGSGVWLFVLSMIVYGVAFDFFNISGSLFVNQETDKRVRSSAQGLFMLMTNGLGATTGTLVAQGIVNKFVNEVPAEMQQQGWVTAWYIFAAYALVVAVLFMLLFRYKHTPQK